MHFKEMICSQHLLKIFIHYQKKSEFPSAVIFLQAETYHSLKCRYAGKNIPLLSFHLKMSSFAFILKNISIPHVVLNWLFIGLLFLMRSLWCISSIFYGANWVSGTKFRETTSSQKVSNEETVICKSEAGRETTRIEEQTITYTENNHSKSFTIVRKTNQENLLNLGKIGENLWHLGGSFPSPLCVTGAPLPM